MGYELVNEIEEILDALDESLEKCEQTGLEWADAECCYKSVRANTSMNLFNRGYSATKADSVVDGIPEVNDAFRRKLVAAVQYDNAKEARNVLKKRLDTRREQLAREWTQAGERN